MKVEPVSQAALVLPTLLAGFEDGGRYVCTDGVLSSRDIAKAAGVTPKAAKRAINAYCEQAEKGTAHHDGATLTLESSGVPAPNTQTRAQLARIVAERVGLGRFAVQNRIEERAANRPPVKPREKRVSTQTHPWKVGSHGRSVKGAEGGGVLATLACSRCPATESIRFRQLCGLADMDRKFIQKGWAVDPAKCSTCNPRNHHKEAAVSTLAAKTSPAAIAAQGKMFVLLQSHFDADSGCYSPGWSDAKIAEECGLALELISGVRAQAFGELKEPDEVAQLARDIEALAGLIDEQVAPLRTELTSLRARLTEVRKKFAA